jgi:hypothetical protein
VIFFIKAVERERERPSQCRRSVTTDGQSVNLSRCQVPIWGPRRDFCYCQTVADLLMWGALYGDRAGVIYNCVWSSPAQSFSERSTAGLMAIFYCLRFETPPTYIPPEEGGPVIPPGTGFPFRCFLRLSRTRWRCSNRLPRGGERERVIYVILKSSVRTSQGTHCVSVTTADRLMLFRETIAVCCENHTEHINTLCGQKAEFL